MTRVSRKAFGYFVRTRPNEPAQLLVRRAGDRPTMLFRLPGGTLLEGETPESGVQREVFEEAGLSHVIIHRKLGVQYYFKPFIGANVERHDFLVTTTAELPDTFTYMDSDGGAGPALEVVYSWVDASCLSAIDEEFRQHLTPDYLPEWFLSESDDQKNG